MFDEVIFTFSIALFWFSILCNAKSTADAQPDSVCCILYTFISIFIYPSRVTCVDEDINCEYISLLISFHLFSFLLVFFIVALFYIETVAVSRVILLRNDFIYPAPYFAYIILFSTAIIYNDANSTHLRRFVDTK